jgi:hypothetical protein
MKLRVFATLSAVGFCLIGVGVPSAHALPTTPGVVAEKKVKAKAKVEPAPTGPAKMKGKLGLSPKGVAWGVALEQVAKIYDKTFDHEFVKLYKKAQPGTQMQALDSELADKKRLLRQHKIEFGVLPTGIDQTALKGEYSYGNKESMTRITLRTGVTRNFFFFEDKLWKVYDEHKLRKGGPYGENWEEALAILTKKYGAAPYKIDPDYAHGRNFEEAQWQDGTTVIRAVNRAPVIGLAYQDASIYFSLAKYRTHRIADPTAVDKDVAAATAPPPPPPEKKDDGNKKKKKKKGR